VADSYTLNFSRPAAGAYCQLFKFLRLGREGTGAHSHQSLTFSASN